MSDFQSSLASIVIPVYNGATFLRQAIESCLSQTWPNLEIIVVDDGSSDSSYSIASEFAAQHSHLRVVKHERNLGVSEAWNSGFNSAQGQFRCRLAQDDSLVPQAIEKLIFTLRNNPEADVAYSDCWFVEGTDKQVYQAAPPEQIFRSSNRLGLCVMITDKVWNSGIRYDPKIKVAEDLDFFLRVSQRFTFCKYFDEPLLHILRHAAAGSSARAALQERETAAIRARHVNSVRERARIYGIHYSNAAFICRDRGQPLQAALTALSGLTRHPFCKTLWKELCAAFGRLAYSMFSKK